MGSSLPLPIRLVVAGLAATVALVVGAVALRTPPYVALEADEAEPPPAPSDSAPAVPGPSAHPFPASLPGSPTSTSASVAPAEPLPPPSADAREARTLLHQEIQLGHYSPAAGVLARLIELEPRAAEDREVRTDIVELSMRVTLLTGGEADRVFQLIAQQMGPAGIDLLYELLTTRGGSRAATRADDLLRDPATRARGTPALRVAYDLRVTPGCDDKKALFPRAAVEGDGRTLGQLQALNHRCGRRASGCCMQNDADLRAAMDGIKARSN